MTISYKLSKKTTKTEKFEKFLKTNIIKNFWTNHYKLIALRNFFHSILISMLTRPLSILRLQKIKKTVKNGNVEKNSEIKVSEPLKSEFFS